MSHSYRRRVETIDAVQYNGTNEAEMMAFAPEHLEIRNGKLCQVWLFEVDGLLVIPPSPIVVTEWVFRHTASGMFERMTDDVFQRTWQPGGAAP